MQRKGWCEVTTKEKLTQICKERGGFVICNEALFNEAGSAIKVLCYELGFNFHDCTNYTPLTMVNNFNSLQNDFEIKCKVDPREDLIFACVVLKGQKILRCVE